MTNEVRTTEIHLRDKAMMPATIARISGENKDYRVTIHIPNTPAGESRSDYSDLLIGIRPQKGAKVLNVTAAWDPVEKRFSYVIDDPELHAILADALPRMQTMLHATGQNMPAIDRFIHQWMETFYQIEEKKERKD